MAVNLPSCYCNLSGLLARTPHISTPMAQILERLGIPNFRISHASPFQRTGSFQRPSPISGYLQILFHLESYKSTYIFKIYFTTGQLFPSHKFTLSMRVRKPVVKIQKFFLTENSKKITVETISQSTLRTDFKLFFQNQPCIFSKLQQKKSISQILLTHFSCYDFTQITYYVMILPKLFSEGSKSQTFHAITDNTQCPSIKVIFKYLSSPRHFPFFLDTD